MSLPKSFKDSHVCIIGLGYVGLTLAVAMADSGFRVHGVEKRQDVLDLLDNNEPHFWEPRLIDKLVRVRKSGAFTFSKELSDDVKSTVYIITVGTPLDKEGNARLDMVQNATTQVINHMDDDALVILRSTVKLGTTRNGVKPLLEKTGRPYKIAFCPERTLEGRALIELHQLPQIIGADDADTRWRCQQLFGQMTPTTVALQSLESAELVKLVDNTYRDLTFGFANEIAKLCTNVGISAMEVIESGKLGYPRTNVALPGPVGGPCLEKDPHILFESAKEWGVDMSITMAGRLTNEEQPREIGKVVKAWAGRLDGFSKTPKINLLGLAFKGKPSTDDLRGTMALPILKALQNEFPDAVFKGYDPVAEDSAIKDFFNIDVLPTLESGFNDADVVMILNNHQEFQVMELPAITQSMSRPGIVYDLWNMHGDLTESMPEGVVELGLGRENVNRHLFGDT